MPIWSRPALWNVKKYVFLGWDPHAGTHQHWPRWRLWRNGASLGLVKRNQINLQLDLVPFNQLQRRMRYGTRCAPRRPSLEGLPPGGLDASCPEGARGEEWVQGAGEKEVCKMGFLAGF